MAERRMRLKHLTADAHARLDARVEQHGFFAGEDGYRHYLRATWRARAVAERMLDGNGAAALYPLWPQRRLSALIRRDMQDVGLQIGHEHSPAALQPVSAGAMLGALYVLEGSALGARIIGRRVAQLGMTQDFGARHLNCQNSSHGAWAAFLELLEATPLSTAGEADCLSEALATFALFDREYQQAGELAS